jgi:hypothetical protein
MEKRDWSTKPFGGIGRQVPAVVPGDSPGHQTPAPSTAYDLRHPLNEWDPVRMGTQLRVRIRGMARPRGGAMPLGSCRGVGRRRVRLTASDGRQPSLGRRGGLAHRPEPSRGRGGPGRADRQGNGEPHRHAAAALPRHSPRCGPAAHSAVGSPHASARPHGAYRGNSAQNSCRVFAARSGSCSIQ